MTDGSAFLLVIAVIWIGWPLQVIAARLTFICKQIKERP